LKELHKLITLINTGNIRLYIPEQTKNEFHRNREVKIADSMDKLLTSKLANQFPMICHAYTEYDKMKKAIKKEYESNRRQLLEKLQHDAEKNSLLADDVLNQLISKGTLIDTSEKICTEAVIRF
jgi:hypothetical protein